MKVINKLKLNQFSKFELEERQMSRLFGGGVGDPCGCACQYADSGGSDTYVNCVANSQTGSTSSSGTSQWWISYGAPHHWENGVFYFEYETFGFSEDGDCPF